MALRASWESISSRISLIAAFGRFRSNQALTCQSSCTSREPSACLAPTAHLFRVCFVHSQISRSTGETSNISSRVRIWWDPLEVMTLTPESSSTTI